MSHQHTLSMKPITPRIVLNFCLHLRLVIAHLPFRCPRCQDPFELPDGGIDALPTNYFTLSLSGRKYDRTQNQDLSTIRCDICDEHIGSSFCLQCAQFFCEGCQRCHKRARGTATHQFISSEVALTDKASIRVPTCPTHSAQEITAFCLTCKEPICPECGVKKHSTHAFSDLKEASVRFQQELRGMLDTVGGFYLSPFLLFLSFFLFPFFLKSCFTYQVKKREGSLKEAIESLGEALEELTAHSKTADDAVRNSFADLRLDVDRREREVLEELRKTKERKETELRQQKEELEALLAGIRISTQFTEKLLADGTEVEIAMTKSQVLDRLEHLVRHPAKPTLSTRPFWFSQTTAGRKLSSPSRPLAGSPSKLFPARCRLSTAATLRGPCLSATSFPLVSSIQTGTDDPKICNIWSKSRGNMVSR